MVQDHTVLQTETGRRTYSYPYISTASPEGDRRIADNPLPAGQTLCCSVRTALDCNLQRLYSSDYLPAPQAVGLLLRPLKGITRQGITTQVHITPLSAAEPARQAAPQPPIYRACNTTSFMRMWCLYIGDNLSYHWLQAPLHPPFYEYCTRTSSILGPLPLGAPLARVYIGSPQAVCSEVV